MDERFEIHTQHYISNVEQAPVEVIKALETFAAQGIEPEQLFQWYLGTFLQRDATSVTAVQPLQPPQSLQVPAATASVLVEDDNKYACPWCDKNLRREKDFIRHVKQTCFVTHEYRCPEPRCHKTFHRKKRFTDHHLSVHPRSCGRGDCDHSEQATVAFSQDQTLGCGFCGRQFDSDLHPYLRHLIDHYRLGSTRSSWAPGPNVPMRDRALQPPQLTLSPILGGSAMASDFAPFPSGFRLQFEAPPSSRAGSSFSTTLTFSEDLPRAPYFMSPMLDPEFDLLPPNICFQSTSPSGSNTQHFPMQEILNGVGEHSTHTPLYNNTPSPSSSSVSDLTLCARLAANAQQVNTYQNIEDMIPPFNATPPLPQSRKESRKRSLSGRLRRALHSLS